jgi:hypothetical protein
MQSHPKILFWNWTEPDKPSGSPAVLAALLASIPSGKAEVVCEDNTPKEQRRKIASKHPITRLAFHRRLWPFSRGYRIRQFVKYLGVALMILYGLGRVYRSRPDCLLTVYYDELWILSSFLISKIARIPVIYYVHDPYYEAAVHRGGLTARLAKWLEPRSLRHGHVMVLYGSLRDHYANKYDVHAEVVRQIALISRPDSIEKQTRIGNKETTIGFAGAIYDNNRSLLLMLAQCARETPVQLKIWTSATTKVLGDLGLTGERIAIRFERNYDRLIEGLAECDLLYLPLGFTDTPTLPAASLRYVLPTKAVDYLSAGPPILVHCPNSYETSRFFAEYEAGYQLNNDAPNALREWIVNWHSGAFAPIEDRNVLKAVDAFASEKNLKLFRNFVEKACASDSSITYSASTS